MIKNILLLILLTVISGSSAQENLKEYYYPIGPNKQVKIYKYVDKNNSENIEYWKVTTDPDTNTILTESYTTDFRLYNIFFEQLNEHGADLIKYADFVQNDKGQNIRIDGSVVDKYVFKWTDTDKYSYSVKYKTADRGNEQFTKERTKNSFETIIVNGIEYSALKFLDEYEIKSLEKAQNYEFYQLTYYAKGLGMVKYQRYFPNGLAIELELSELLTEKEFEELIKKASR